MGMWTFMCIIMTILGTAIFVSAIVFRKKLEQWMSILMLFLGGGLAVVSGMMALTLGFFSI